MARIVVAKNLFDGSSILVNLDDLSSASRTVYLNRECTELSMRNGKTIHIADKLEDLLPVQPPAYVTKGQ